MLSRWYRTGVIYSLDVGLFQDASGDGIGDFQGLIARLDYLARLGVTTIWLNPIHPSPRRDGGYDITDYFGVHPRFGSLGDFAILMHEAGERGIRVMLDLVVNHTSEAHPWFQAALSDPHSNHTSDRRPWFSSPRPTATAPDATGMYGGIRHRIAGRRTTGSRPSPPWGPAGSRIRTRRGHHPPPAPGLAPRYRHLLPAGPEQAGRPLRRGTRPPTGADEPGQQDCRPAAGDDPPARVAGPGKTGPDGPV
jgi:Alpha amylase, catalytic domain